MLFENQNVFLCESSVRNIYSRRCDIQTFKQQEDILVEVQHLLSSGFSLTE